MTAAPTGPGGLISAVLTRADQEISDAEAGIRYAAEVNQGVLLAAEEARADAWRTVRALLAAPTGPGEELTEAYQRGFQDGYAAGFTDAGPGPVAPTGPEPRTDAAVGR